MDFPAFVPEVDRDHDRPDFGQGEVDCHIGVRVPAKHGDPVAHVHAQAAQAVGQAIRPLVQFSIGEGLPPKDEGGFVPQARVAGVFLEDAPQKHLLHRLSHSKQRLPPKPLGGLQGLAHVVPGGGVIHDAEPERKGAVEKGR